MTPSPSPSPAQSFNAFADFGKLVPGFDFLQSLANQAAAGSNASAAPAASLAGFPGMPSGMGSWIAPTLNVEDLERRIQELKTVQFWLDQNATALRATIQAMELQKMTLATLSSMNVGFSEMVNAFQAKPAAQPANSTADTFAKPGGRSKTAAKVFAGLEIPPKRVSPAAAPVESVDVPAAAAPSLVDPMQWWGALTQQFQAIAADALKNAPQPATANATVMAATPSDTALSPAPYGLAAGGNGAISPADCAVEPNASFENISSTQRKKTSASRASSMGDTQKAASAQPKSQAELGKSAPRR